MYFLFFLLLLLAVILLISRYTYQVAFFSPVSGRSTIDDPVKGEQYEEVADNIYRISHIMEKIPFEPITIESHDGLKLYGRYYHIQDGAPIEILFHGYRSCAYRDCSGGHALARKMGFNTLVVDQRAHGNSEGTTITFGILERCDCLSWIHYVNNRFGDQVPVLLSGLSMGAATVLMVSGLNLPQNVQCILADSPFSAPIAIIEKVCKDMHYPVLLCRPFLYLGARLFGKFHLGECNAKDSVRKSTVPILLIHGEADHFVPCEMSGEIAACCASSVTVHTFPGAGHGLSYMVDPVRYEKVIYEFLCTIPNIKDKINEDFVRQVSE